MAEVIAAIGTAGAIAGLVDVLGRTIQALNNLRQAWNDADMAFLCLLTELGTFKAALTKIQEWVDSNEGDMQHLLVMDLDTAISCCQVIVNKFNGQLVKFKDTPDGLSFTSKIKLVFGSRGIEDLEKLVQRQTAALTFLLVACNCQTLDEQKKMLRKSQTRKALKKMEDDSASLFVHHDRDSILTRYSDALSRYSIVFEFDPQLYATKVYDRVIRAALRRKAPTLLEPASDKIVTDKRSRTERRQVHDSNQPGQSLLTTDCRALHLKKDMTTPSIPSIATMFTTDKMRSEAIERVITKERERLDSEQKVLLLSSSTDSSKSEILQRIRLAPVTSDPWTPKQFARHRQAIFRSVAAFVGHLLEFIAALELEFEVSSNMAHCAFLFEHSVDPDAKRLDPRTVEAIASIWHDPRMENVKKQLLAKPNLSTASFFFSEIRRIGAEDYIPTRDDIRMVLLHSSGVTEYYLEATTGTQNYTFIDISSHRSEREEKWLHVFEDVDCLTYVVNLAQYDETIIPSGALATDCYNPLQESLLHFGSLVSSRWFKHTEFVLLLNNVEVFMDKISKGGAPLAAWFPNYDGDSDPRSATRYIISRFTELTTSRLRPVLFYSGDAHDINRLMHEIRDVTLQRALAKAFALHIGDFEEKHNEGLEPVAR